MAASKAFLCEGEKRRPLAQETREATEVEKSATNYQYDPRRVLILSSLINECFLSHVKFL